MRSGRTVRATIKDNGAGFVPALIPRADEGRGRGVFAMRERAALMGGHVEVRSHPGEGTCIDVMLPCGNEQTHPDDVTADIAHGPEHCGN